MKYPSEQQQEESREVPVSLAWFKKIKKVLCPTQQGSHVVYIFKAVGMGLFLSPGKQYWAKILPGPEGSFMYKKMTENSKGNHWHEPRANLHWNGHLTYHWELIGRKVTLQRPETEIPQSQKQRPSWVYKQLWLWKHFQVS